MSETWNPTHYKNFATGVLSGTYSATDQNIYFTANQTGGFPNLPFNLVLYNSTDYPAIYNDPNYEVVRVTGALNNGFAVTRGFSTTTGSAKNTANKTYVAHQSIDASIFNDQLRYFRPFDYGTYLIEDFTTEDNVPSTVNWTINNLNSAVYSFSGAPNNPGFLVASLVADSNSAINLRGLQSGLSINSGITDISFLVAPSFDGVQSSNTFTYRFGLTDATGVEKPINGIYFEINSNGAATGLAMVVCSGNLFNSGISVFPDSVSKALVGFSEYKIKTNSARNIANFYINNIEISGSFITGGLPIIQYIQPYFMVKKEAGSQLLTARLDYLELKQIFEKKNRY